MCDGREVRMLGDGGGDALDDHFIQSADRASDANDVIRVGTEVVTPRSCSRPHLVVLQQVHFNKHTQLCAVTKGRHARIGFGDLFVALTAQFIAQRFEIRQCSLILWTVGRLLRCNDVIKRCDSHNESIS